MDINKKIIIFAVNLVVFIVVAFLIYSNGYSKYKRIYHERYVVYERFNNISNQLDDFGTTQMNMDEQKDSVLETLSKYSDAFIPNTQILNSYKVRIAELLKEIGIENTKDTSITQIPKEDNIVVEIKMNATYEQICRFLFEIERVSAVTSIDMDYKGDTTIVCSPILYSTKINDNFSGRNSLLDMDDVTKAGYFKEISDNVSGAKNVGYIPSWRDFEPIPKSPFYLYVKPKAVAKKGYRAVSVEKPEIVLDGIMYEANNPMVIIDGQFYYTGSKYKNCRIVKINQNNIVIDCGGRSYTIRMEN